MPVTLPRAFEALEYLIGRSYPGTFGSALVRFQLLMGQISGTSAAPTQG